jgi:hypothetical protein
MALHEVLQVIRLKAGKNNGAILIVGLENNEYIS